MSKALYVCLGLGIALCLSPLVGVIWSSWFAARHGCRLDEAGAYACVVNGQDWGGLLGAAFLSGWLMLVTLPIGGILVVALVVKIAFDLWRRSR
ncbi:hypothetical protein AQS8620_01240 [Aquimixticola soesokkakensis]|uniref:Uncharacterized protein n=1 Tax=Aquimixticola soesokkakensis TaxID=1519096 RepID=A0A1Y5SE19_9RHOB|nr:hypothetical protein [Aquimixticola soesokkakensis]SLN35527.1 hypothetical protein AQS8620_01240 [Aquimixticola soesokkakensis]